MRAQVILTVSESKRLIAKGVASLDIVKSAMAKGIVVVASGSTNAYIAEELLGRRIEKERYLTGHTLPAKIDMGKMKVGPRIPPFIFKDGGLAADLDIPAALQSMKRGDVFIKGANALNYERRVAGILIGDPKGGTIGSAIGHLIGKRAHLLIPVGLEKCVGFDIEEVARTLWGPDEGGNDALPRMMAVRGQIITEIEALAVLAGVRAMHIAAGGIGGAEGGSRLLIEGEREAVERAMNIVEGIQGEPPFFMV